MDPQICVLSRSDGGGLADDVDFTDKTRHYLALDELDFSEPGVIRAGLWIVGSDRDDMAANYQRIEGKLREAVDGAAGRGPWVTLEFAARTTHSVFYDVLSGTLTPGVLLPRQGRMRAQLELRCLPWARGTALPADTVTATLTNGSAQFLRQGVPGDLPAFVRLEITDESSAGVINLIRLARRSAPSIAALGDFDPWVDVAALSGATDTPDATAFGGSYATRTVTATTWSDLARAVMPAGVLNRGKRDLWARIWDTATVMAVPTSLTATAQRAIASRRQSNSDIVAPVAPTWSSTTLDGSTLLGIVSGINTTGTAMTEGTTPANYSLASIGNSGLDKAGAAAASDVFAAAYTREGAPATASGTSVAMNVTGETLGAEDGVILELANVVGLVAELGAHSGFVASSIPIFEPPTAPCLLVAYAVCADANPVIGSGFTQVFAGAGLTVATKRVTTTGAFRPSVTTAGADACLVNVLAFEETPVPDTYHLEPGAYGFRVQPRDKLGTLGNATATTNRTLTQDQEAIALSWVAPAGDVGSYRVTYSLTVNGSVRYFWFDTPDASTSYLMTSTEGHAETTGLPATTGAVAPPARLKLRIGTAGTPSAELSDVKDEVILTGAGVWRHVKVASARDLPPVGEHLDGDRPEWAIEAQIKSANGLSATVRLDVYWQAAQDEPQATIEYPGLALGTKYRWVGETDRRGRSMTWRLEVVATGAEIGALRSTGAYTLAPGDNIIALLLELAAELSDMTTAKVTVIVTIIPRYRWQDGGL